MIIYLVTWHSNPVLPPQIRLRADLQQIESKAYLFTHCQAGPSPQHPWSFLLCQWQHPCRQQEAIAGGSSLLFCLLPVRGLKVGNILVLHPAVLAVPGVALVLPALVVPVSLPTLFWWVPLKLFIVHNASALKFLPNKTSIALETRWSVVSW